MRLAVLSVFYFTVGQGAMGHRAVFVNISHQDYHSNVLLDTLKVSFKISSFSSCSWFCRLEDKDKIILRTNLQNEKTETKNKAKKHGRLIRSFSPELSFVQSASSSCRQQSYAMGREGVCYLAWRLTSAIETTIATCFWIRLRLRYLSKNFFVFELQLVL
jgi:hypothetical protein